MKNQISTILLYGLIILFPFMIYSCDGCKPFISSSSPNPCLVAQLPRSICNLNQKQSDEIILEKVFSIGCESAGQGSLECNGFNVLKPSVIPKGCTIEIQDIFVEEFQSLPIQKDWKQIGHRIGNRKSDIPNCNQDEKSFTTFQKIK